jgi:hypothetical protein
VLLLHSVLLDTLIHSGSYEVTLGQQAVHTHVARHRVTVLETGCSCDCSKFNEGWMCRGVLATMREMLDLCAVTLYNTGPAGEFFVGIVNKTKWFGTSGVSM